MENRRILTTGLREEDRELEPKLRPATLDTYIGQESVKENMRVFIEAAKQRGWETVPTFFMRFSVWIRDDRTTVFPGGAR